MERTVDRAMHLAFKTCFGLEMKEDKPQELKKIVIELVYVRRRDIVVRKESTDGSQLPSKCRVFSISTGYTEGSQSLP